MRSTDLKIKTTGLPPGDHVETRAINPLFRKRTFLLCFAALFLSFQAAAQVELRADSNHVETGNPLVLQLKISATLGKPDSLNLGAWSDILPRQNIVNQSDWQSDGQFFTKTLTALFFEEDSIDLPPLPVAFRDGNLNYSNPLRIIVSATPSSEDLNDMAPIKNIHREPTRWTDYWPWMLGVLVVLTLLGLLFRMANRMPATRIQSRSIEIAPHELALKKLDLLAQKQWTSKGLVKAHYAELSFIVREYLEKRFGIPALESTTEETLGYLDNRDFPKYLSQQLQTLLQQADLAKFAKIIPAESFHAEAFQLSRDIILQTSAHPEPPITG